MVVGCEKRASADAYIATTFLHKLSHSPLTLIAKCLAMLATATAAKYDDIKTV